MKIRNTGDLETLKKESLILKTLGITDTKHGSIKQKKTSGITDAIQREVTGTAYGVCISTSECTVCTVLRMNREGCEVREKGN
jgi:hypothetical protein